MKTKTLLLVISIGALGLAGCGNRGALERAAPLWGEPRDIPAGDADRAEDSLFDDEDDSRPRIPGSDPFDDDL